MQWDPKWRAAELQSLQVITDNNIFNNQHLRNVHLLHHFVRSASSERLPMGSAKQTYNASVETVRCDVRVLLRRNERPVCPNGKGEMWNHKKVPCMHSQQRPKQSQCSTVRRNTYWLHTVRLHSRARWTADPHSLAYPSPRVTADLLPQHLTITKPYSSVKWNKNITFTYWFG